MNNKEGVIILILENLQNRVYIVKCFTIYWMQFKVHVILNLILKILLLIVGKSYCQIIIFIDRYFFQWVFISTGKSSKFICSCLWDVSNI